MDQNLTYSNLIFLLFQQNTHLVSAENVFNENWSDILWFGSLGRRGKLDITISTQLISCSTYTGTYLKHLLTHLHLFYAYSM